MVDDQLVFSNIVSVLRRQSNIVISNDIEMSVTCSYDTASSTSGNVTVTDEPVAFQGLNGYGELEYLLDFYTDSSYQQISGDDDVRITGERMYLGITPKKYIAGVWFVVKNCTISDDAGNAIMLIDNMCPNEALMTTMGQLVSDKIFRMSYTAFRFNGD